MVDPQVGGELSVDARGVGQLDRRVGGPQERARQKHQVAGGGKHVARAFDSDWRCILRLASRRHAAGIDPLRGSPAGGAEWESEEGLGFWI